MAHANNIITAPVRVYEDIAAVLGRNVGDVWQLYHDVNSSGTLITNPAVKMWAKRKPVPWSINGVKALNPQGDHPVGSSHPWFKGIDGDYGIVSKTTELTGANGLIAATDGNLNGWSYQRDALVARVLDFDGYYHAAENPFDTLYIGVSPSSVAPGGSLTMDYQLSRGDIGDDYQIGLFDLAVRRTGASGGVDSISTMYPAIAIFDNSGNYVGWASASETIGALQLDPAMHHFDFTAPNTTGTYKVIPFLSPTAKASQAQPDYCVTIPGVNISQITVANNVAPYMQVDAFVFNHGTSQNPNFDNTIYFYCNFMGGSNRSNFDNICIGFEAKQGGATVAYKTLYNVQNEGSAGILTVEANQIVKKPEGSGNVYSTQWNNQYQSLENFVRTQNGVARIYCATAGSLLADYSILVREAAGMPGGQIIPFNQ